ncbi:hypothetical protein D3C77_215700 [compost metagenome]
MPRQAANGQSQDTTFLIQACSRQPLAQRSVLLANALLELAGSTTGARCSFAPQRAGGVQVQNGQARIGTLRFAGREKAATVGERQQVTDLGRLPAAVGNTRCQHLVEQITAGTGEQP